MVLLLTFINTITLHSQDISINLSIQWNEGPYILNTDSIVKHPELVISYTNNSEDNLYFRKFSHYRNGFSDFSIMKFLILISTIPQKMKIMTIGNIARNTLIIGKQ